MKQISRAQLDAGLIGEEGPVRRERFLDALAPLVVVVCIAAVIVTIVRYANDHLTEALWGLVVGGGAIAFVWAVLRMWRGWR